jgi:hypothetical protein
MKEGTNRDGQDKEILDFGFWITKLNSALSQLCFDPVHPCHFLLCL